MYRSTFKGVPGIYIFAYQKNFDKFYGDFWRSIFLFKNFLFDKFIETLVFIVLILFSQISWATTVTCVGLDDQVKTFGSFGLRSVLTIETSYPTPTSLIKACDIKDIPNEGVRITIEEDIKNVGETPWNDWHSVLRSEHANILIGDGNNGSIKAFLTGITGYVSIFNGAGAAANEASLDGVSVLFDDPIEMNEMFTLTQEIFIPGPSSGYSFTMTETASVDEPSSLLLLFIGYLAFLFQRKMKSSPPIFQRASP